MKEMLGYLRHPLAFAVLCIALLPLAGVHAQEDLFTFPYLGVTAEERASLEMGFSLQWTLFGGLSGNNDVAPALYYLALCAALVGALLMVFNKRNHTGTTAAAWFIMVIIMLFAPYNSKLLFYPIKGEDCSSGSSVSTPDNPKFCGFTPQIVAVHLASVLHTLFYDLLTSQALQDAVACGAGQASIASSDLVRPRGDTPTWVREYLEECRDTPMSGRPDSEAATTSSGQEITLGQMVEQAVASFSSDGHGNNVLRPIIVLTENPVDVGWDSGQIARYLSGVQELYKIIVQGGAGPDREVVLGEASQGQITVQRAVQAIRQRIRNGHTTGMPNSLGYFITTVASGTDLRNNDPALQSRRNAPECSSTNLFHGGPVTGDINCAVANASGSDGALELRQNVFRNVMTSVDLRNMPVFQADIVMQDSGGYSNLRTEVNAQVTTSLRCDNERVASLQANVCMSNLGVGYESYWNYFNTATWDPGQRAGRTFCRSLAEGQNPCDRSLYGMTSTTYWGSIAHPTVQRICHALEICPELGENSAVGLSSAMMQGTMLNLMSSVNPQRTQFMESMGDWRPDTIGFWGSSWMGILASFGAEVVTVLGGVFSGATAMAFITMMKYLLNIGMVAILVMTPIFFFMGLLIPGNAIGLFFLSVMGLFVLKLVPVTWLIINFLASAVYEGVGGSSGSLVEGSLVMLAVAGLYLTSVGLTLFILFKIGDPGNISALAKLDGAAREAAEMGNRVANAALALAASVATAGVLGAVGGATAGKGMAGGFKAGVLGKAKSLAPKDAQAAFNAGAGGPPEADGPPPSGSDNKPQDPGGGGLPAEDLAGMTGENISGADLAEQYQNYLDTPEGQENPDEFSAVGEDYEHFFKKDASGQWRYDGKQALGTPRSGGAAASGGDDGMAGRLGDEYVQQHGFGNNEDMLARKEELPDGTVGYRNQNGDVYRVNEDSGELERYDETAAAARQAGDLSSSVHVTGGRLDEIGGKANLAAESTEAGDVTAGGQTAVEKATVDQASAAAAQSAGAVDSSGKAVDDLVEEYTTQSRSAKEHADDISKKTQEVLEERMKMDAETARAASEYDNLDWKKRAAYGALSGMYGSLAGKGGLLQNIPVIGGAIHESLNERYEAHERMRGMAARGGGTSMGALWEGFRQRKQDYRDTQRGKYWANEVALAGSGESYRQMSEAGTFGDQINIARQNASEAAAQTRSLANAMYTKQQEILMTNYIDEVVKNRKIDTNNKEAMTKVRNEAREAVKKLPFEAGYMNAVEMRGIGAVQAAMKVNQLQVESAMMGGSLKTGAGEIRVSAHTLDRLAGSEQIKSFEGTLDGLMMRHYKVTMKQKRGEKGDVEADEEAYAGTLASTGSVSAIRNFVKAEMSDNYRAHALADAVFKKEAFKQMQGQYEALKEDRLRNKKEKDALPVKLEAEFAGFDASKKAQIRAALGKIGVEGVAQMDEKALQQAYVNTAKKFSVNKASLPLDGIHEVAFNRGYKSMKSRARNAWAEYQSLTAEVLERELKNVERATNATKDLSPKFTQARTLRGLDHVNARLGSFTSELGSASLEMFGPSNYQEFQRSVIQSAQKFAAKKEISINEVFVVDFKPDEKYMRHMFHKDFMQEMRENGTPDQKRFVQAMEKNDNAFARTAAKGKHKVVQNGRAVIVEGYPHNFPSSESGSVLYPTD